MNTTMTVLGQDQKIRERISKLQEMHAIVAGQIADARSQLEVQEANLSRIEGGIIELQVLVTPADLAAVPDVEEKK